MVVSAAGAGVAAKPRAMRLKAGRRARRAAAGSTRASMVTAVEGETREQDLKEIAGEEEEQD